MMLEFWERLRGYDRWMETEATVLQSEVLEFPWWDRYGRLRSLTYKTSLTIAWNDRNGGRLTAGFKVGMSSPLYLLSQGQDLVIRYHPGNPERFYLRDLERWRIEQAMRIALGVIVVLTLLIFRASARRN